jgi:GAF domain-containing protein
MAVDGQLVARTVGELRTMLAEAGDLLGGFQRVVDATRTVVGVDGAGLTLAHEDGPPRWVATTDRAMELLEQIQQDFGEGPCLAAYAEDWVVAVEDLRRAPRWDRIAAVVGQLQVRGMVSVPVRLAGQPVGTLDAYTTNPRAWSAQEIDALGALAAVTADLIHTGAELAAREIEVAQLRQALVGRVWIEQAKGVLAGTRGISPDAAFQQLREQARSSRRKLADLAQEVVQDAQRERIAAVASTTPGSGPPRPALRRPSRRCGQPRLGFPDGPRPWIGRRTLPMLESGPPTSATMSPRNGTASPTNANRPLTHATGPQTTPASAVG